MEDYVPRDVLIDILIRLPIKTLVRCTCVCKSWYSLLTNPSFITTHLNRNRNRRPTHVADNSITNTDLLMVLCHYDDPHFVDGMTIKQQYSLHFNDETFDEYAIFEFPSKSLEQKHMRIIGSCNGLICLCHNETLFLWNPMIRRSVALPPVRVSYKSHNLYGCAIGFGFDYLTNDYKVIRIAHLEDQDITPQIDIYTVNTGAWRNISHLGLPYNFCNWVRQAYLNGAAHWVSFDKTTRLYNLIVSFSMSDEVFREIKPPNIIAQKDGLRIVDVVDFQGSLSLVQSSFDSDKENHCIWLMKEYGVVESWTKHIVIDVNGGNFSWVVGFNKKGEVLLETRRGYLVSYDPKAKHNKVLGIHGSTKYHFFSFNVEAYTESLVLLGVTSFDTLGCEGSPELLEEGSGPTKTK